jgi:hypothetical protein
VSCEEGWLAGGLDSAVEIEDGVEQGWIWGDLVRVHRGCLSEAAMRKAGLFVAEYTRGTSVVISESSSS